VFLLNVAPQLVLTVDVLETLVEVAPDPVPQVAAHFCVRGALEAAEAALAAHHDAGHHLGPRVLWHVVRHLHRPYLSGVFVRLRDVAVLEGEAGEGGAAVRARQPQFVVLHHLHQIAATKIHK